MDLDDGYGIFEINIPKEWVGKSLLELDLRNKKNISIIGIKENGRTRVVLKPDLILNENETLLVVAKIDDAGKLFNK